MNSIFNTMHNTKEYPANTDVRSTLCCRKISDSFGLLFSQKFKPLFMYSRSLRFSFALSASTGSSKLMLSIMSLDTFYTFLKFNNKGTKYGKSFFVTAIFDSIEWILKIHSNKTNFLSTSTDNSQISYKTESKTNKGYGKNSKSTKRFSWCLTNDF